MPVVADIYYYVYNENLSDAPPVVLIHGAGGNHLYFPPKIRRMEGFRVFALDLPGHGKSGGVGKQTILAYAQAVVHWMDDVKLSKAILVGHSMGGAIAMTIAHEFPERVLGLGLIATGARLRVAKPILENSMNVATFPKAVDLLLSHAFGIYADNRMKELAKQRMLEVRPTVLYADMVACDVFDVMPVLSEIEVPALVICGDEDKLTPLRFSQYLADRLPNARLKVIPGAGHMVILEKPDEVVEAVQSFGKDIVYQPGK